MQVEPDPDDQSKRSLPEEDLIRKIINKPSQMIKTNLHEELRLEKLKTKEMERELINRKDIIIQLSQNIQQYQ